MKYIIFSALLLIIYLPSYAQKADTYVCLPCGSECDATEHKAPGQCEHCQMPLVLKSTVKHKSVSPDGVCDFIARNPGVILLDVRTPAEFNGTAEVNFGTLKNAINIPIQELEARISELEKYKSKKVLVFCSHSHRSPRASYMLTQNGFRDVVNMDGGMSVMNNPDCKK